MKITDIRAVYPNYRQPLGGWRPYLWQIVVRVETDAGVSGYGYGGGGVAAVEVVNRHLRELLLDERCDSVAEIERLWDKLYTASIPYGRGGIAIMALSGIDLALWDLLGRAERQPVYALLGGTTAPAYPRVRVGQRPRMVRGDGLQRAQGALWQRRVRGGFRACRGRGGGVAPASGRGRAADVRLLYGVGCGHDAGDGAHAGALRHLLVRGYVNAGRSGRAGRVRRQIKPALLAGGEHDFTHHRFAAIAQAGALDIWQPDVTWCGGITAARRIVQQAQAAGVRVVLHRGGEPWGLHVIAGTACDKLAELVLGNRNATHERLWLDAPQAVDGYLTPSDAPGFGLRLNEALVE